MAIWVVMGGSFVWGVVKLVKAIREIAVELLLIRKGIQFTSDRTVNEIRNLQNFLEIIGKAIKELPKSDFKLDIVKTPVIVLQTENGRKGVNGTKREKK